MCRALRVSKPCVIWLSNRQSTCSFSGNFEKWVNREWRIKRCGRSAS